MEDIYREAILNIKEKGHDLSDKAGVDLWVEKAGSAKVVMLGEASHGTHEFYTWRSRLSKELIEKKGFNFILVEGDWPDCYLLNRFIKGYPGSGSNARQVLDSFSRWPTWMWANWEVCALMEWLKDFNSGHPKVGFYGMDVYSLWDSLEEILRFLGTENKESEKVAMEAIKCFEPYREDVGQLYARSTQWLPEGCTDEVVSLLSHVRVKRMFHTHDNEEAFSAEQNALVTKNAERYYRAMVSNSSTSWNIRDKHMMETIENLLEFHGKDAKVIIWAHNTHIGDARATDMNNAGMVNIGQLAREKYGKENVFLTGFGTYRGQVMASDAWGEPMEGMRVPDARKDSWEDILHSCDSRGCLLFTDDLNAQLFKAPILHRAIGVVYDPSREHYGNYVPSIIPERYDAFIHIDTTRELHALHQEKFSVRVPETYPFGV